MPQGPAGRDILGELRCHITLLHRHTVLVVFSSNVQLDPNVQLRIAP